MLKPKEGGSPVLFRATQSTALSAEMGQGWGPALKGPAVGQVLKETASSQPYQGCGNLGSISDNLYTWPISVDGVLGRVTSLGFKVQEHPRAISKTVLEQGSPKPSLGLYSARGEPLTGPWPASGPL